MLLTEYNDAASPEQTYKSKRMPGHHRASFLYKENPALDAGFHERYAFDQKTSMP